MSWTSVLRSASRGHHWNEQLAADLAADTRGVDGLWVTAQPDLARRRAGAHQRHAVARAPGLPDLLPGLTRRLPASQSAAQPVHLGPVAAEGAARQAEGAEGAAGLGELAELTPLAAL